MTAYLIATRDGAATTLTDETIEAFRRRLTGRLRSPAEDGFGDATRPWNAMVDRTPALVVTPADTADVSAAVDFARAHDLALSVRGGGHNIAGTALADGGLTIDMSRLRGITVDPLARTATVQAGCLLGDVDRATQEHGLATPLGFISEVGVAGLTLGGGLGYLTRRFGWTVDNLLEVTIVTADGVVRRAGPEENPDLFWAVRGAGANVGAVTDFTFRLHPVGPTVYGGLIAWPFEWAPRVMAAYRDLTARAPRELTAWLVLLPAPEAPFVPTAWHGRKLVGLCVCYSGDPARADSVIAPVRALGEPVVDLLSEMPYTQVQSYLDDGEPKGMHYYWRTEFLDGLSDEVLETARDLFAECPIPLGDIGFLHLEGALNTRDEDDGAVGNRGTRFALGVKGMWAPDEPDADRFRQWVRDAGERIHPFGTGRTYINFQTADEPEGRVRATYGANYDRLTKIKARYDPTNLFRSNRNVGA